MLGEAPTETGAEEVLAVLAALQRAGCRAWVGGGWGVDLLVGAQTRRHRDLDLAVDAGRLDEALAALVGLGYAVETDWLPVRVELCRPGGGIVDVHPLVLDEQGNGLQAGLEGASFAYPREDLFVGSLDGRPVPCLSARLQLAFHQGYEPREVDRHDLAQLSRLRPSRQSRVERDFR